MSQPVAPPSLPDNYKDMYVQINSQDFRQNFINLNSQLTALENKCNADGVSSDILNSGDLKNQVTDLTKYVSAIKDLNNKLTEYNTKSEVYYNVTMPAQQKQLTDPIKEKLKQLGYQTNDIIADISNNINHLDNYDQVFSSYKNLDYYSKGYNNELNKKNVDYISKDISIKKTIFENVITENNAINAKIDSESSKSAGEIRDSTFLTEKKNRYTTINKFLLAVYYICFLGFIYEVFVLNIMNLNIYVKIIVIVLFAGYPFYINWASEFVIYLFTLLYSLFVSKVYKDPQSQYDTNK